MILPTRTVKKPWGRVTLPPPFLNPGSEPVGEIWFEPPDELPQLLVKYIFTSEKLSVQVHPSDTQTLAAGIGKQGKEECWLVIDAQPGAVLGIGFDEAIDAATMRAAAIDGSIEGKLTWHPVQAGDFFYIPAGTVHAIGAGVTLVEVQQNVDVTYRLYDYGRPRELHLDDGVAVSVAAPYTRPAANIAELDEAALLDRAEAPFTLELRRFPPGETGIGTDGQSWFIPLAGHGTLDGQAWDAGQCWLIEGRAALDAGVFTRALVAAL